MAAVNNKESEVEFYKSQLENYTLMINNSQELSRIGSWDWNVLTNEVQWSDMMYVLMGYEPNEVKPSYELALAHIPKEDKEEYELKLKTCIRDKSNYYFENRMLKKDGSINTVISQGKCVLDNKGELIRMVGTVQDVSEKNNLTEKIRKEKKIKEQYLQLSNVFFLALDTEGIITMINHTGCNILGQECEFKNGQCVVKGNGNCQIEGLNWFDNFIPIDERKKVKTFFNELLKGVVIESEPYENCVLTKNGEQRLISWNNSLIKDSKENITGVLCSGQDITEQREAEKALIESENLFRTLFETATESIIITNNKGEITKVNDVTNTLFGYSARELYGKPIELLIPQRYKKAHATHHRVKFLKESPSRSMGEGLEIFALKKDGTEFPVEISLNNVRSESESFVMAIVVDITERQKAKLKLENLNLELEKKVKERTHELKESQHMYSTIARNFPNGVINVLDKKLNYVFVEGMEMFKKGITGEMLIGTNFLDRIDLSIREDLRNKLLSVLEGKDLNFELEIENRTYLINAVGLKDVKSNINQILMVTQNISNLKKAKEQILQSLAKEQQLNELKSRFVSMASHEFRTPLTTVLNSVTLISKYIGIKDKEEKQHNHVKRIKASIRNLTNILNDFLSLDKLEAGKIEITSSPINIPDFSQDSVEIMEGMLKNGQHINYHHQGDSNISLDSQMLSNVYNNLLSNAIKYSPEDSEIEFETVVNNRSLKISVTDQGIGIPKEEQQQLFQRFFRANNATNIQGTGLGLNIVKKYLDMVGGEISFTSIPKRGTTFIVTIPEIEEKNIKKSLL